MNRIIPVTLALVAILLIAGSSYSQESPQAVLQKGNEYYLKGEFSKAVEFYTDYLGSFPQNVEVLNFRGLSYLGMKDYPKAIQDFSSAIGIKRSASMSYVYRASAYISQNNFPAAKKDCEDALFYDVKNIEAYYMQNFLYLSGGQYEHSLETLEKVIALEPKSARGYFMKAITYTFEQDTNKIFENVNEGLSWDSTYFQKDSKKDLVFVRYDRYKFAIDLFTKQIQNKPMGYLPYFSRGMIYYMMGNYDMAYDDLKKSLELNKAPTKLITEATNRLIRACYRVN
jgi:tetratricopeptide (TPR) repeat protein